jgi:DNA replication and repair protein RecF
LLKGSPAHRREFLDTYLRTADLKVEAALVELERVLRQRSALLHQMAARRYRPAGRDTAGRDRSTDANDDGHSGPAEITSTLDVWDQRLDAAGTEVAEARERLVEALTGPVQTAYRYLSGSASDVGLAYCRSWEGDLKDSLRDRRAEDVRIQATGCGPHRDDLAITLDGMPARTHASQGEQRCLALALRLSCHELASATGPEPPALLLDDVFSELDDTRARLLAERLPAGQVLVASAVRPPSPLSGMEIDTRDLARRSQ